LLASFFEELFDLVEQTLLAGATCGGSAGLWSRCGGLGLVARGDVLVDQPNDERDRPDDDLLPTDRQKRQGR
jgi:hypothetical protein